MLKRGDLVVSVINTLVCRMPFLATDTRPCVLINAYCLLSSERESICIKDRVGA